MRRREPRPVSVHLWGHVETVAAVLPGRWGPLDTGSAGILILGSHPPELRNKRLLSTPPGQWGSAT